MDLAPPATDPSEDDHGPGARDLYHRVPLPRRGRLDMMIDVQSMRDERRFEIEQVGIRDVRYPIVVLDRRQEKQHTIARISMSVGLPHHQKGTHMSRFVEILHEDRGELTVRTLPEMLRKVKQRLDATTARIEARFP